MRGRRFPSLAARFGLAALLSGCSEPVSSDPGRESVLPSIDLSGRWRYVASGLAGSAFECGDAELTIDVHENLLTHVLTGTAAGAPVECRDTADNVVMVQFINRPLKGWRTRSLVEIDFGCWEDCDESFERWISEGRVEGDSIVGAVDLLIYLPCICPYPVPGEWKAVRE